MPHTPRRNQAPSVRTLLVGITPGGAQSGEVPASAGAAAAVAATDAAAAAAAAAAAGMPAPCQNSRHRA